METNDTTQREPKIGFPPTQPTEPAPHAQPPRQEQPTHQTHDVTRPSDEYKTRPDPAARTETRRPHAGMDPAVRDRARESDVPDADEYARPMTERASNMNLWAAVTITVIIAIVMAMLIWALVG